MSVPCLQLPNFESGKYFPGREFRTDLDERAEVELLEPRTSEEVKLLASHHRDLNQLPANTGSGDLELGLVLRDEVVVQVGHIRVGEIAKLAARDRHLD